MLAYGALCSFFCTLYKFFVFSWHTVQKFGLFVLTVCRHLEICTLCFHTFRSQLLLACVLFGRVQMPIHSMFKYFSFIPKCVWKTMRRPGSNWLARSCQTKQTLGYLFENETYSVHTHPCYAEYRSSIVMLDKEGVLPICCKSEWEENGLEENAESARIDIFEERTKRFHGKCLLFLSHRTVMKSSISTHFRLLRLLGTLPWGQTGNC